MNEATLADIVAAAYEAATGGSTWFDFGTGLCQLCGGDRATLRMLDGTLANLFAPHDAADAAYLSYFNQVDPYRAQAAAATARASAPPDNTAQFGHAIVPRPVLVRSEYFADYASRYGTHHMMGGKLGLRTPLPVGLHRDASGGPFTEQERLAFEQILPHLQRALQMQSNLRSAAPQPNFGTVALDALSQGVLLVNSAMEVLHANAAGAELMAGAGSGLTIYRGGGGGLQLAARHRDDNPALRRLVARTAAGGSGGAMRIRANLDDAPEAATLAVMISPVPARFAPSPREGLARGIVMVTVRELSMPRKVRESMLSDLYGLTRTEAMVAGSLAGGVTAEEVARSRQVSLDTVRTQVRNVLRKTNAANLRDFERIIAVVSG